MIAKNQYPICEFDTNKNPIIHPTGFLTKQVLLMDYNIISKYRERKGGMMI